MRPPSPSFIFGSEVVGVTESRFSDKPVHTLPVFSLIRAAVSPPTTVVVLALMSVLTPVLTVDALMVEALVVSVRMVSPLCCAMSNRGVEEETPASASLFFTLNRAAFWFFSEVTHTVPSSSCTWRRVTVLMITAPATSPRSSRSVITGTVHVCPPEGIRRRKAALMRRRRSYDWDDVAI